MLSSNYLFAIFSWLLFMYVFYVLVKTNNLIPIQSHVSLTEEQEQSALRSRVFALFASGISTIFYAPFVFQRNIVLPVEIIPENFALSISLIIFNIVLFRRSQIKDYELYNVPIFFPPNCQVCGSSQHSQIYCNAPGTRPTMDWAPTLDSLSSEPLGDRGDLKKRFYYLKGLSQPAKKKTGKKRNKDFDEMTVLEQLSEMRAVGFKLKPEHRKDLKKAIKDYKQQKKIRRQIVVATPLGPVEADFPLQCSGGSSDREKIEHVATLSIRFDKLQKQDDDEVQKFIEASIGQKCDQSGCSGTVELRDG